MRTIAGICLGVLIALAGTALAATPQKLTDGQKVPRIRFTGDAYAQMATVIFTETLQDMRNKIEDGTNPKFPAGFFHTSTEEAGVPQYYNDMWSRDCGRGLIELSRLGFANDVKMIARYFLTHKNFGDHWGREIHKTTPSTMAYEIDGNAWALTGICQAWKANGKDKTLGKEFCDGVQPVVNWISGMMEKSPYHGLMPSISELSGNPSASYFVYSVFGNYGIYIALSQVEQVAQECGQATLAAQIVSLRKKMEESLSYLISDGDKSYAPKGCWYNGIDGRNGHAYDMSEWDGTAWPIWHWTRQLPYIQDYDNQTNYITGIFADVHKASYKLLRQWMNTGIYFRKYGFVSNTGWTGMGGRHDETMCGYGQGFFTQAALMADDVNTYGKCLEGIARLGYDGNVISQMSYEKNPFVMHECFNFDNYEAGLDHTFGVHKEGRREIMENPGDEGNLVQEAEIIKAFTVVVGASCVGNKLVLMPRLPWLWDGVECIDYPVVDQKGKTHRISFAFKHERWLRKCTLEISGAEELSGIDVRFGPFPRILKNSKGYEVENGEDVSWIWMRDIKSGTSKIEMEL